MFRIYFLIGVIAFSSWLSASIMDDTLDTAAEIRQTVDYAFENNRLSFKNNDGDVTYTKDFTSAELYCFDLDNSGTDELIVMDKTEQGKTARFMVYVYSADSLPVLVDSINSGMLEPFIEYNEETGSTVISAGCPWLDSLYLTLENDSLYLPAAYYHYTGGSIKNITDELYSTYIKNNEPLVELIEKRLPGDKSCPGTRGLNSAIFTAFFNYRKAGEFSLANKLFKLYYPCPDNQAVRNFIERF